jgi:hypothetical protein
MNLRNKLERTLIIKMAECAKAYYEPHDSEDRQYAQKNAELKARYNLLWEICGKN